MKKKELELYESPTSEVVGIQTEGIVCESNGASAPGGQQSEGF